MICALAVVVLAGVLNVVSGYATIPQGATFQWQLTQTVDTSVSADVFDIDLFITSAATMSTLKSSGKIVICYFSAGSYENWRPDVGSLPSSVLGNTLHGWPDEKWWNVTDDDVRDVISARLDMAVTKGCDGVEPDNVDAYDNNGGGLGLTMSDLEDFLFWIAEEAHNRNMSVGLKNALSLIPAVESDFDWALNEECFDYDECSEYFPFINSGKAVFHTEYVDAVADGAAKITAVCGNVPSDFSTIVKLWDLDAWRLTCP
ncbi:uncharacterized protein LOC121373427 [Gigantopelta aegis]|uniref:uncharacterized protein LOC121373427 n=1 Tax=Gigantopelta aegis TaxID=1735272 RepID=UPI001B8896E2|nr:uncharacterized protein LOC121373427 [Gigantopelta aegis]